jgi:hypothetical protein
MTAEMFEQVGPEFAGVGGTSGKKKPGPVPVLQADGTIKIGNRIVTPADGDEYFNLRVLLLGTAPSGETDFSQDVTKFNLGLRTNSPQAIRIRQLMVQNGVVSATAGLNTILNAYEDLLQDKAAFAGIGQNFTLEQLIEQSGFFNTPPGSGVPKGPVASVTEVDYGKGDIGDKSQGARQARKLVQDFFRESIGRNGTPEEIEEMRVALVKASAKSKPTTTVTREGGRTVTKVTPGFDIKSWASGYISTKFADEDVAGSLGAAQDKLKGLARSYGIDMGDSWYATAAQQVGKGVAVEDFLDEIKQTAIGRYPGLSDRINKGANVFQIASPYIQAKSRILEMDANSIDLDDMDIQKAIGFKDDKGAFGTRPLWEYEKDLRTKPEWQYTKNAKDSYDSLMLKVLRDFGLMG